MKILKALLGILSLAALSAFAHEDRFADVEYEATDLGNGIYRLEGAGGNIGLSVGEDGAFLIDDQFAQLGAKLLTKIASITNQPLKYVINTHGHGDHVGGNAIMAAAGATIVAHDNVRASMVDGGSEQFPEGALPVITFSENMTFYFNGHTVRVIHPESAHTNGDAMIHFEEANVLHVGDVLFNGLYPYIDLGSGGSVDGYLAGIELAISLCDEETKVIAGHGPLATKADLQKSHEMIATTRAMVKELVDAGMSLEEVQAADPLKDFHGKWAWRFITAERFTATLYNDLTSE